MYAVDMVEGFLKMDSVELKPYDRETRFRKVFCIERYKASTYDNQVQLWKRASQVLREKAIAGGRTEAGLWSALRRSCNAEATAQ
jgi:hypothetical protein